MVVTEVECKSILNRSRISAVDYTVNPYLGCAHGCRYCYAVFMKRFARQDAPWGDFVQVKVNAPIVLRKQLGTAKPGLVNLSTVTDPYQPVERKYRLTRKCLKELSGTEFEVSVLTKSDLVLRDLDVLKECNTRDIGITITTLDEGLRRIFEPGSPPVGRRLDALRRLNDNGFATWVFFGPVLPFFSDNTETCEDILSSFSKTGTREILVDSMNLSRGDVRKNVGKVFQQRFPELAGDLKGLYRNHESYQENLRASVLSAARGLPLDISFCF